ncbi:MAG: hypothetical protein RJQ09_01000 [Cyclobacteriaceae bacterium]
MKSSLNWNWNQIQQVCWITLAWVAVSLIQIAISYVGATEMGFTITMDQIMIAYRAAILSGMLAGLIGGSAITFFWEKWLRSKPYGWTLKSIFISFTVIYFIVSIPTTFFFQASLLNLDYNDPALIGRTFDRLFSSNAIMNFFFWLMIVLSTMILLLVNDKYGPGVFGKFLMGRYFNPKRKERIFMFLDLRSSTAIAEKLGEEKYFRFLKEVYKTVTPAILKFKGDLSICG